jgi:hypothetical protein
MTMTSTLTGLEAARSRILRRVPIGREDVGGDHRCRRVGERIACGARDRRAGDGRRDDERYQQRSSSTSGGHHVPSRPMPASLVPTRGARRIDARALPVDDDVPFGAVK